MDTRQICVQGIEVEVCYAFYPPCRGSRDRYGVPLEPDEDSSVEIQSISIAGQDITEIVGSKFFDLCYEELLILEHENQCNDDDHYYEAERDRRMGL
jgi:hypothetical protein